MGFTEGVAKEGSRQDQRSSPETVESSIGLRWPECLHPPQTTGVRRKPIPERSGLAFSKCFLEAAWDSAP
jgi:hypothetical protein